MGRRSSFETVLALPENWPSFSGAWASQADRYGGRPCKARSNGWASTWRRSRRRWRRWRGRRNSHGLGWVGLGWVDRLEDCWKGYSELYTVLWEMDGNGRIGLGRVVGGRHLVKQLFLERGGFYRRVDAPDNGTRVIVSVATASQRGRKLSFLPASSCARDVIGQLGRGDGQGVLVVDPGCCGAELGPC